MRARLAEALPVAMKARDRVAVDALRTALASIDNAGAVEVGGRAASTDGPIAGAAAGVGATEATRRALTEEEIGQLVEDLAGELRAHAREHERAARPDDAAALAHQAHVLERHLAAQRHPAVARHLATYERERVDDDDDRQVIDDLVRLAATGDPWSRGAPVHFTGSALVVDSPSRTVLLRWHERQQGWLQVGGHVDPGEDDPFDTARREAEEETGLADLEPWPDPQRPELIHAVIVPVPAGRGEPPHQHADLRFVLATRTPHTARAESPDAPVRWMTFDEARAATGEDNVRIALDRLAALIEGEAERSVGEADR
jgi:8-oxo-dGTP pyrophosphatase MutT (NUDIX family)/uncharacterized protein YqeY